jgi:non-ribosomal peptide synthetase-like protein
VESYVALLAVLKIGAAFVPIDVAAPAERVAFIAEDAQLALVLSARGYAVADAGLACPVWCMADIAALAAVFPSRRPPLDISRDDISSDDVATAASDPACYVIYTSGSSGRPKGVEVTHRSICNFIDVATPTYRVTAADRVYQGMTLAFDFSIEEIWPTWAVGATLVAGPTDDRRLGAGLAEFLRHQRITMLYCVPTVLATIDRDLPDVRTLIVGGEACPAELVDRWSRPGRWMLNTYGPTETTVTATWAELRPGRPVTIGRPLPTYQVSIRDEHLGEVANGVVGEICIAGPGVAHGYLNRAELTRQRFVDGWGTSGPQRLYRTGDLGRILPDGQIEFVGRADSEVKIRGHRIDLQEIESLLLQDESVGGAAAKLLTGGVELAAYVTRAATDIEDAQQSDTELLRRLHAGLRHRLPPYMVPAYLNVVPALPMLASGKVDRAALPEPRGSRLVTSADATPAATALERAMVKVWAEVLNLAPSRVSVLADFFVDLGGHSLLAATLVTRLRVSGVAPQLSVADLYRCPTIRQLAAGVEASPADRGSSSSVGCVPAVRRHGTMRVTLAGAAQAAAWYLVALLFLGPVAAMIGWSGGSLNTVNLLCGGGAVAGGLVLARFLLPVVGTRLLTAGLRPGRYPLWGRTYLRIWLAQYLMARSPISTLSGSPLLAPYLRALGARVGRHCHIATAAIGLPAFINIADGVSIGYGARLETVRVAHGWVTLRPVVVGRGAFVGANAVVMPGARLHVEAELAEQSLLAAEQVIPARQRWAGSPSTRQQPDPLMAELRSRRPATRWPRRLLAGFAAAWVAVELLPLLNALPAGALCGWALLRFGVGGALAAGLAGGPLFVATTCLTVVLGKRTVLPRTPTGIHPARSGLGLRKYLSDKLLDTSLATTNTLYATLYTVPWLRALGARIGARSEVSTAAHLDPDLLDLGRECFVADMASIGPATYYRGYVALGRTTLAGRAFLGNAALARSGTWLGHGSLVGVHSLAPRRAEDGTSWLGSPPLFLPRREDSPRFGDRLTYHPARWRVAQRLVIESVRIVLPGSLLTLAAVAALSLAVAIRRAAGGVVTVLALPGLVIAAGLAVVLTVALLKWLLVGRYRPRVEPLWSTFVRRSELVTGIYEAAAVPALLAGLCGTPMLPPLLRLFGARIGHRVWLATTYLTEFDLVHLGDDVAVGAATSLQTHLFEDRVMKMSTVTVHSGASIATRAVVLYDGVVGTAATLDALSLVMKGEQLAPRTGWRGIPAAGAR